MVATDDGKAIKTAKFLNLPFIITPRIVIDLFNLKKISREHARKAIEKQKLLIAYQVLETEILFYMIDTHENFYRKLKKYLKEGNYP